MNRALVAASALILMAGGALFLHGFAVFSKLVSLIGVGLIMLGLVLFMKPLLDWCEVFDQVTQAIDTDSEDESNDLEELVVF
jgi:hypothetical protein